MVLQDCVDLDALEQNARRVMRPESWVFCDTGADDEITAKENVTAWRRLKLRPRMLRDIVKVDTSVSLLGARVNTPIMVAPTGRHHLFHAEGELATARGAAAAGALYVMSTSGTNTVEDVAKAGGGAPQWFQLYMQPDREAHRRAARPLRRRRLQGAGAHRRPAGAGLEPARLSHAGGRARRRAQRQHGRPAGRAHRLRSGAQGRGDVPDHFRRSGMAGEALRHAGGGEGRAARRRRARCVDSASRASWCRTTAAGISTPP